MRGDKLVKKIIIPVFLICFLTNIFPGVTFSSMDVSQSNILYYTVSSDFPGYGEYETLFYSHLDTGEIHQLTFFPEQIMVLDNTNEIQIQNRYGVFRVNLENGAVAPFELFSSFVHNTTLKNGKLTPIQSSPDGRYLLYISNIHYAYGDLMLYHIDRMEEYLVSKEVEIHFEDPPSLWSGDSRYFVYSKKGNIYYFSIDHLEEKRVLTEGMRIIGKGVLRNTKWAGKDSLYYISGTFVQKISSKEFFTRSFYKEILRTGIISGKIPFTFDPNFDNFWIAPDGKKILLSKGGRNLFLYFLKSDDYTSVGDVQSLPYLYLPHNSEITRIIWSRNDQITVLARKIVSGERKINLFRIAVKDNKAFSSFIKTDDEDVKDLVLSPDEQSIILIKKDRVELRNYLSWQRMNTVLHPQPLKAIWKSGHELVIAGGYSTIVYNFLRKKTTLLTLSKAGDYGFSPDESSILMKEGNTVYKTKTGGDIWEKTSQFKIREPAIESESYRVYVSESTDGVFDNMIMVRNIAADSFGTFPLFEENKTITYEPFPEKEDPISFDVFNHGSRLRRREVALVFNVIDSIQGLPVILNVLADYHIKATFFINGEAIARYPGGVREIAASGHETGSLFYTYFNMTDSKYNLDKEFIKKGLGINEDEYFAATGYDLDLYWHAPYYFVSSEIIKASREMNYTYVGKDVDTMDWVTEDEDSVTRGIYLSSAELIRRIMKDKKPGSIIPINAGLPRGERDDYLFKKLDILINALLNSGYSVVPVSTLIKHAK
jgi:peptidoglycan/xylan/chitin deacetylase (PgdA/CDA1 family)/WD40 repeat protein